MITKHSSPQVKMVKTSYGNQNIIHLNKHYISYY